MYNYQLFLHTVNKYCLVVCRRSTISEDPPPYEVVIADQALLESPDTFDIVRITHRWQDDLVTSEGSVDSPDNGSEPPSYDEYMKRMTETQTDT